MISIIIFRGWAVVGATGNIVSNQFGIVGIVGIPQIIVSPFANSIEEGPSSFVIGGWVGKAFLIPFRLQQPYPPIHYLWIGLRCTR
jgi:hypothetical protein